MAKITGKKLALCTQCFCVLGDATRMRIFVYLLKHPQAPVGQIAKSLRLSLSTTSHSLAKLLAQKLAEKEKKGRSVLYSPTRHPMSRMLRRALLS